MIALKIMECKTRTIEMGVIPSNMTKCLVALDMTAQNMNPLQTYMSASQNL